MVRKLKSKVFEKHKFVKPIYGSEGLYSLKSSWSFVCHPKSLIFLFNLNKSSPRHSNHRIMTQVSRALCFLISQFWGRTWVGTSFFISAVKSVLIRACCKYAALVNSVMAVGSLFFILWFLQVCIYQVVTVGIQSL